MKDNYPIDKIVIHCTDSPDNLDVSTNEIREWHKERNFDDIGYHFVIRRSGDVEPGRDLKYEGAHVFGENERSIAICWVGSRWISHDQWVSLIELTTNMIIAHGLYPINIYGHSELNKYKTCPNLDMNRVRSEVRELWKKKGAV